MNRLMKQVLGITAMMLLVACEGGGSGTLSSLVGTWVKSCFHESTPYDVYRTYKYYFDTNGSCKVEQFDYTDQACRELSVKITTTGTYSTGESTKDSTGDSATELDIFWIQTGYDGYQWPVNLHAYTMFKFTASGNLLLAGSHDNTPDNPNHSGSTPETRIKYFDPYWGDGYKKQ